MEYRGKVKDLEDKLKGFDALKEKNRDFEKEVTVLQLKLEALVKEEALKRQYLEKDLRREFEMEKRTLLKKEPNLSL